MPMPMPMPLAPVTITNRPSSRGTVSKILSLSSDFIVSIALCCSFSYCYLEFFFNNVVKAICPVLALFRFWVPFVWELLVGMCCVTGGVVVVFGCVLVIGGVVSVVCGWLSWHCLC